MSKYTTEVRYIVDTWTTAPEGSTIEEKINGALSKVFNFTMPIWESGYLPTLQFKILQHYYMREIGFETAGLWQFYLKRTLQEKMPYFNDLYKSVSADYDFLSPLHIIESIQREVTGSGDTTANQTQNVQGTENYTRESNNNRAETTSRDISSETDTSETRTGEDSGSRNDVTVNSDLPQATIGNKNIDYASTSSSLDSSDTRNTSGTVTGKNVGTNKEAYEGNSEDEYKENGSNSSENHLTGNNKSVYNDTRNETITNTRTGNPGGKSYSELIQEYREALINIDSLVIESLESLFMGLW